MIFKWKDKPEVKIDFTNEQTMHRIGALVVGAIIRRTVNKHIDIHGAVFKEYGDRYKMHKEASGRSGVPNLTWSGNMFRGLTVIQVGDNMVEVGFSQGEEMKKAIVNNERREFMGLTKAEEKEIIAQIALNIANQIAAAINKKT